MIPNDNLMYRDAKVISSGTFGQSVQDANLLKIHVGYCYELIIPFINRMVWAMQRYGPGSAPASEKKYGRYWADPASTPPGFFGPPEGDFATSCITNPADNGRLSIALYSQALIRMQSAAVECETSDSCV
jgi:predicted amidohydrolase